MKKVDINNLFQTSTTFIVLMSIFPAIASDHSVDPHGSSLPQIFYFQTLNFGLLCLLLFVLLRKPVIHYFSLQKQNYLESEKTARAAKEQALAKMSEVEERINKLTTTAQQSREKAHQEAELIKKMLAAQSAELVQRAEKEVLATEKNERVKAQNKLREILISESVSSARDRLKKDLKEVDLKKLQTEFVNKIQVVNT